MDDVAVVEEAATSNYVFDNWEGFFFRNSCVLFDHRVQIAWLRTEYPWSQYSEKKYMLLAVSEKS